MPSHTPEIRELARRLEKLEAQNRKLKWGGAALLAIVSCIVLMGQSSAPPQVIEAQRFVLKDSSGTVRAWLGVRGGGSELTLGNINKQPRMTLMVSEDASDLHFFGSRNSGMNLGVDAGDPAIAMADGDSNGNAGIAFSGAGPALTLQDAKGASAIVGAAEIKSSGKGQPREVTAASVALLDKSHRVVWRAP